MNDNIEWLNPGHKQRRYDLRVSKDKKFFKKSTHHLHSKLDVELKCLEYARELKLTKIQQLVEGSIDQDGISYLITKYCGRNITRSKVPENWKTQLDIIDSELKLLMDTYKVFHNDVQVRNLFVQNGELVLIDFDLATIGHPARRSIKRPGFTNCNFIKEKFHKWGIK